MALLGLVDAFFHNYSILIFCLMEKKNDPKKNDPKKNKSKNESFFSISDFFSLFNLSFDDGNGNGCFGMLLQGCLNHFVTWLILIIILIIIYLFS